MLPSLGSIILTSETSPSISRDIPNDPARKTADRDQSQVITVLPVGAAQTNGCVRGVETQPVGGREAANTRLILRLMMDSAAKTLSPTAESSMVHHAPRLFLSLLLFGGLPSCPLRVV